VTPGVISRGRQIFVGLLLVALVGVGLMVARAQASNAPLMGIADLDNQRMSGDEAITLPQRPAFEPLYLRITVGVEGTIEAAQVIGNQPTLVVGKALATVRQWKMRPQQFEGQPIRATGVVTLYVRVPEIPPEAGQPFPDVPPDQIEISLERRGCYGPCPEYRVSVTGDGKVRFSAGRNRALDPRTLKRTEFSNSIPPGQHEDRVDPKAALALVERFKRANFLAMRPEYRHSITHGRTDILTLRLGNQTKSVIDYLGREVGMPAVVTELEDAVDVLTQSRRWVLGNGQTAAYLKAQGFDFKSQAAAQLLYYASVLSRYEVADQDDFAALVTSFLAEGLDLETKFQHEDSSGQKQRISIGSIIAAYAAEIAHEPLFDLMLRNGQYAQMTKAQLNAAFLTGMGCNERIARALVAAGADPRAKADEGNALNVVIDDRSRCSIDGGAPRVAMVATLVSLGVPVNARDDMGYAPLTGCNDHRLTAILLKAGANPNATDSEGVPAVMRTDDDRVALLLLRAGANPFARDERETLRQKAKRIPWPATLAWLDQRGIK
jgi:Domain of unknown function (DUF6438)